ncbi:50S ribosomal protein L13 [Carboxylicivirga sp. N1Y90]|uniref:50S ribosomal protein L13 n=1 Tax=Carboxylicivirga fragile TaxID=3417571 RepID=UPI003D32BF61|nr:50S ribosomal protein L13 [Marinilabiliaceae bacterium N1Y90]
MDTLSYKTISANKATANKEWVIVDAADMVVGRMASKVAKLLRGKYKPSFTPHVDCGDNVIIINAEKVILTGQKWDQRKFFYHSGYPGGRKDVTPAMLFAKKPERLVERAIKGMLPKNRLGRQQFRNLYVYTGSEHGHEAQQPKVIDINAIK